MYTCSAKTFTRLAILVGMGTLLLAAMPLQAQSWDDWAYRRPIVVDNTTNPNTLTDYQVLVTLTPANFNLTAALPEGADIRFTDGDGETELDHWIETWDGVAGTATIWVEVPLIPGGGNATLYLYYGNPLATPAGDGAATFLFYDDFETFGAGGMNAPAPLTIPTYEGSGQIVHPDVIVVDGGWNGYDYWMGMTPYPNGNDDYENPSVVVSNDNVTWIEPPGISNPLVPMPPGHNDDTEILLVDGTMVMYYNETNNDGNNYTKRLTSTDGVTWTAPQAVITVPNYCMSPAVIYDDGTYYMWYLRSAGGCTAPSQDVYLRSSSDGITWSAETPVNLVQTGRVPWHFDVQKVGGTYVMLYISYANGSNCGLTSLYYAESTDRINWTTDTTPILAPRSGSWDSYCVYRASFTMDGTFLRIWYSARSTSGQWRVGYTEGDLYDDFYGAAQQTWDSVQGNTSATTDHPRTGQYGLRLVGGSTYPWVAKNLSGGGLCLNAWLYDPMTTTSNNMALLRAFDPGTPTYPIHTIGTGMWMGTSTTRYAYHREGFQYFATAINRSLGWHKLSIEAGTAACDLIIDGQVVATLADLDEANLSKMSLEGYQGGTSWFDDAYLRKFSAPEPMTDVGEEEVVAVTPGDEEPPAEEQALPAAVRLEQNYPNPLNPETVIRFALPAAGTVRLQVLDLQGRVVRTLIDGRRPAGQHQATWDGRDDRGLAAASGTYVYRLTTPTRIESRKLTLVR
jgi:predicted GH43/DUF377 family glycosyl hydrolase